MSDLRDFLNWFDGFAENIDKTPNTKQWGKIKERVTALRNAAPADEAQKLANVVKPRPAPAPAKPAPSYPFIIDKENFARNGKTQKRVLPGEVTDIMFDLRGLAGDAKHITWADDSTGLNGAGDITITVA